METHDNQCPTSQSEDRLACAAMQTAANSKDENLDLENVTSEECPEETGSCPLLVLNVNVPSQFPADDDQQSIPW